MGEGTKVRERGREGREGTKVSEGGREGGEDEKRIIDSGD